MTYELKVDSKNKNGTRYKVVGPTLSDLAAVWFPADEHSDCVEDQAKTVERLLNMAYAAGYKAAKDNGR